MKGCGVILPSKYSKTALILSEVLFEGHYFPFRSIVLKCGYTTRLMK